MDSGREYMKKRGNKWDRSNFKWDLMQTKRNRGRWDFIKKEDRTEKSN